MPLIFYFWFFLDILNTNFLVFFIYDKTSHAAVCIKRESDTSTSSQLKSKYALQVGLQKSIDPMHFEKNALQNIGLKNELFVYIFLNFWILKYYFQFNVSFKTVVNFEREIQYCQNWASLNFFHSQNLTNLKTDIKLKLSFFNSVEPTLYLLQHNRLQNCN